jgi:exopolysaccharide production protein ExoQ
MLAILTIVAFGIWFALLYPVLRHALERHVVPLNLSPVLPALLISAYGFAPMVFNIDRNDGTALLDQGLSQSNKLMVAIAALAGCYALWQIARDKRVLRLLLAMPYLPFTLMILFDGLSAAWSVVPSYTAYRTVELAILFLVTVLVFDRSSIERRLPLLMSAFIVIWLVLAAPVYAGNMAHGIVFSSAKNNLTPALCVVLLAYAVFLETDGRMRLTQLALSLVGLVIAGSAASTAAIVGFVPAVMVASRQPPVRAAGIVLAVLCVGGFLLLTVNLGDFPGLLHVVSTVLQKPAAELASATGRTTFWPALIEGTRDRYFGSGFAAAERFPQLLLPSAAFRNLLGDTELNLASAHNMFLSAWVGTGLVGIMLALTVLVSVANWVHMLPAAGRRFGLSIVFVLVLNGMTTPGIFSAWSVYTLAFVAVLAYARVAVGRQSARKTASKVLPAVRLPPITPGPAGRTAS